MQSDGSSKKIVRSTFLDMQSFYVYQNGNI